LHGENLSQTTATNNPSGNKLFSDYVGEGKNPVSLEASAATFSPEGPTERV
jgi:hypothetical protein